MKAKPAPLPSFCKTFLLSPIAIGSVFIVGGSPGHCLIVVDMAVNERNEKIFMPAQSYMPTQDIQILMGGEEDSALYSGHIEDIPNEPFDKT